MKTQVRLYEAFITHMRDKKVYFTVINPSCENMSGFAGEHNVHFRTLIDQGIRLKSGTIFFVARNCNEGRITEQFRPWTDEPLSKKLYDRIAYYHRNEIENVHGWLSDRLIEHAKFGDARVIIDRITAFMGLVLTEQEQIKKIYEEYTRWKFEE